jgi:thiol-disulfide isomerase/thioredoxin
MESLFLGSKGVQPLNAEAFPAAPPLTVSQWFDTPPVTIEAEGVLIIEEWATWCGPCILAMPHLSALAEQYEGQVTVVAISAEKERVVKRFLSRRDALSFSLGVDPSGATTEGFQVLTTASGLPKAYIVKDGEVVWAGNPMWIDPVLAAVVSGQWTPQYAERHLLMWELYTAYFNDTNDGKTSLAAATGAELVIYGELYPGMLNNLSWQILTEVPESNRDVSIALAAAEKACRLEPDSAAHLDTLAVALHQSRRLEEAIAVQERALAALQDGDPAQQKLQGRLEQFRLEHSRAATPTP